MEQIKKNAGAAGKCGKGLYGYYLDGILYIEGTGDLMDHDGPVKDSEQYPGMKVTVKNRVKQIVISEGCRRIKGDALSEYINLEKIILPASVRRIDPGTFMQCGKLSCIAVDSQNPSYTTFDGVLFSKKKRTLVACPQAKTGEYSIPDVVKKIAPYAFYNCSGLTSINLSKGLRVIGKAAFGFCAGITTMIIPKNVVRISDSAFSCCNSLTDIVLPESVTKIGGNAFQSCSALSSIVIPVGVTEIEPAAFSDCTSLTSVVIPDSITKIGNNAFFRCRSLHSCEIPSSVTEIGYRAFYCCEQLSSVRLPESLRVIEWDAFSCCSGLKSVVIPDSVTEIKLYAFAGCTGLETLSIPESVTEIVKDAFWKVPHIIYYGPAQSRDNWGALCRN